MPKLRFVDTEPRSVPVLNRTVEPDTLVEVPDDVFHDHAWPAAQWEVVDSGEKKARKSTPDNAEGI